jgi:hypothetical protein
MHSSDGAGAKKSGSGGGNPEPHDAAELLDRVRGLGDKPVRVNLTRIIWGVDWDFCLKKV